MKKVLFITSITGFLKPGNGGQLRTHFVLKELARNNHVDVYCDSFKPSIVQTPEWIKLGIKSSVAPAIATFIRTISQRRGGTRLHNLISSLFVRKLEINDEVLPKHFLNHTLNRFVLRSNGYEFIILDTLTLYPELSWKNLNSAVWLNAHNVDSILNPSDHKISVLENNLENLIDGVICCTESDEERFKKMNSHRLETTCWPNGTARPATNFESIHKEEDQAKVLFVGSLNYAPNIEGILWYLNAIHPEMIKAKKEYMLTIAGLNPSDDFLTAVEQFSNVTVVPNAPDLSDLYWHHSVSIVPILSGSGSRLKIPESLIHGCPVVSTCIGAEGYHVQSTPGLILEDDPIGFKNAVLKVINQNKSAKTSIMNHASIHFTWSATIQAKTIGLD